MADVIIAVVEICWIAFVYFLWRDKLARKSLRLRVIEDAVRLARYETASFGKDSGKFPLRRTCPMMIGMPDSSYCAVCGTEMCGPKKCLADPAGRECASEVVVLPRELIDVPDHHCKDTTCELCDLPLPKLAYLFICPKHTAGGWCFREGPNGKIL